LEQKHKKEVLRAGLLATWGMATLVLLFCVVLLTYEMVVAGRAPVGRVSSSEPLPPLPRPEAEPRAGMREIHLYFSADDGNALTSEACRLEYGEHTLDNCREALERLILGPEGAGIAVVPKSARIRALYLLDDGELVIDFSGDLITDLPKSAEAETLLVNSVVRTVTQPALKGSAGRPITRVRFLVEGGAPKDYLPGEPRHTDMSTPFAPEYDLHVPVSDVADHG